MSWQDVIRWKVSTAAEAVRAISPRTRVLIGSGASEPSRLVEAMVRDGTHLCGNEIVHLLTLGPAPSLEAGAGVVTSRGDIHYVVTEHGVADLWGKNIRQRAGALIEIAHPDFRSELINAAKNRHYIFWAGNGSVASKPS